MTKEKKIEILRAFAETHWREDDFFDSVVFYYLSGRFPDLPISQCVEIVDEVRAKILIKNRQL